MPLFEVAIIQKPTKTERENGENEKLVFGPEAVIANDPQSAAITAVLKRATAPGGGPALDMQKCEVLVRPFA